MVNGVTLTARMAQASARRTALRPPAIIGEERLYGRPWMRRSRLGVASAAAGRTSERWFRGGLTLGVGERFSPMFMACTYPTAGALQL